MLGSLGTPAIEATRFPARGPTNRNRNVSSSRCGTGRCAWLNALQFAKLQIKNATLLQGEVTRIPALPFPFALKIPKRVFQQSFSEMPRDLRLRVCCARASGGP